MRGTFGGRLSQKCIANAQRRCTRSHGFGLRQSWLQSATMPTAGDPGSTLLLDEYFESGDRVSPELFAANASRSLKAFGTRWYADQREFARDALLRYIDDGCLRAGHRALVKSLFKRAETAADDEAMAHFMVAIDAMPRRKLHARQIYNYASRSTVEIMELGPIGRFRRARG